MPDPDSPLAEALALIGDRWSLLIVEALLDGPRRFNDLEQALGIAPNILSQRLKHLEREGVVLSRPYSSRPARFAYELTASGADLAGALRLLAAWGATRAGHGQRPRHEACGTQLDVRWYCPTCAVPVGEPEPDLHVL